MADLTLDNLRESPGTPLCTAGTGSIPVGLLGGGGGGAAVGYALRPLGVDELVITDIEVSRPARLTANLNAHFGAGRATAACDTAQAITTADGLVNTTPVGMQNHPGIPI